MSPHTTSEAIAAAGRSVRAEEGESAGSLGPGCQAHARLRPPAAGGSRPLGHRPGGAAAAPSAALSAPRKRSGLLAGPQRVQGSPRPGCPALRGRPMKCGLPGPAAAAPPAGGPVRRRHLGRVPGGGAARKGARRTRCASAWLPGRCCGRRESLLGGIPSEARVPLQPGPLRDPQPRLPELRAGPPSGAAAGSGRRGGSASASPWFGQEKPGGSYPAHRTIPLSPEKNCASVGRSRDELTRSGSGSSCLLHGLSF